MSRSQAFAPLARFRHWRARRWLVLMERWHLIVYVQDDQPKLAHYWTHLRVHPWLRGHDPEVTHVS